MLSAENVNIIVAKTAGDYQCADKFRELQDGSYSNKPVIWTLLDRLCGELDAAIFDYDQELASQFGLELQADVFAEPLEYSSTRQRSTDGQLGSLIEADHTVVTHDSVVQEHAKVAPSDTTIYMSEVSGVNIEEGDVALGSLFVMRRRSGSGPFIERGFSCMVDPGRSFISVVRLPEIVFSAPTLEAAA